MLFVGVGDTIQPIIRPRMSGKSISSIELVTFFLTIGLASKHCVWAWTWLYYILFGSQRPTEQMYRDDIHVPRPGGPHALGFWFSRKTFRGALLLLCPFSDMRNHVFTICSKK